MTSVSSSRKSKPLSLSFVHYVLLLIASLFILSYVFNFDSSATNNNNNNKRTLNIESKCTTVSSTPFDLAVQFSYDMIDPTTPSSMVQHIQQKSSQNVITPEKKQPRTPTVTFDVNAWTTRTSGGLQDLDRIFLAKLYGSAYSVFEYGLGESTYIANAMEVPRYSGIDSDAVWVTMARQNVSSHFRFYFADIGDTKAWGLPAQQHLAKNLLHYQLMPLIVENQPFDIYMSDGRWRIPVMMVSFLHASARGADPADTIVLLHDCYIKEQWNREATGLEFPDRVRSSYFIADHLVDLVQHSGAALCAYKRKPTTTDMDLFEFWRDNYKEIS